MTTALDDTDVTDNDTAAEDPTGPVHGWTPNGPGAARLIAYMIAGGSDDPHSHLVIDGETECASGHCARPDGLHAGALL